MKKAKDYFVYFIKSLFRYIIRTLFLFPINNRRILFSSFLGESITDNPKCIYDFFQDQYQNEFLYVWVYNGSKNNVNLPTDVKVVKRFSPKWFYYMATSKVIVDDCNPAYLIPKRDGQFYVETWHAGGAYKKVGISAAKNKVEAKMLGDALKSVSIFISSSEGFTKWNIKYGYHYNGDVLCCGMPRNDIFFDENAIKNASSRVKKFYSLNGKIVLYAPTYRGDLKHSDELQEALDIVRVKDALMKRYHTNINILVRCHHWDKHNYNFGKDVIDAGDYADMQELLCASDMLITDYSSSMWDYALLGRPCMLYMPDLDEYIENRGLFTSVDEWPGIVCKTINELCMAVKNFNEKECVALSQKHLETMDSYEHGCATKIISSEIVNHLCKAKV